ncbi:MAG: noncanonical pyrimidine nucleotidase, YjjG family [Ardenticatenaceae bacterium]|nr:noncanonical pyrimidine nucleotidase, YjjG family [Ardenticatenaceae bacterium]
MTYQWLLFDADNTLFDYDKAEASALTNSFADFRLDFDETHAAQYRVINAQIWHEYEQGHISQQALRTERFRRLFAAVGLTADSAAFSERYLEHLGRGVFLIDGAETLLQQLYGRFHIAIITNGIAAVQRSRMAHSPLHAFVEAFVISEEVGVAKPDPAIFDVAFAQMGQPTKAEVLIIGDSLSSDMQGGLNYGIDTCWYNPQRQPGRLPVTYEIHQLADLPHILNGSAA